MMIIRFMFLLAAVTLTLVAPADLVAQPPPKECKECIEDPPGSGDLDCKDAHVGHAGQRNCSEAGGTGECDLEGEECLGEPQFAALWWDGTYRAAESEHLAVLASGTGHSTIVNCKGFIVERLYSKQHADALRDRSSVITF